MNYKDITNVNKITTIDLTLTNKLDMGGSKIEKLGAGTVLTDAVNYSQLIFVQSSTQELNDKIT